MNDDDKLYPDDYDENYSPIEVFCDALSYILRVTIAGLVVAGIILTAAYLYTTSHDSGNRELPQETICDD